MTAVPVEIVPCTDFRTYFPAVEAAFGEDMNDEAYQRVEQVFERDRLLCAKDGDQVVGGAAAFSFRLTVPGGEVPAAGVTAVGVLPTHRRQGILRRLMERQLRDVRDRGEPVAILWASEGSIYGRFGYGLASLTASLRIARERTAFHVDVPVEGRVRFVTRDEALDAFPPLFEAQRRVTPGFHSRGRGAWEGYVLADPASGRQGSGPKFFALYEVDGRPEGYLIHRVKPDWLPQGANSELQALELIATTTRATRELWRFAFSVDLIATISAPIAPVDHPLLLLLAEPRRLGLTIGDGLWLRIIDLPGALRARTVRDGEPLVFQVTDPLFPENDGRWRLDRGSGHVDAVRTDADPDLMLAVADLGSMQLGGFTFAQLHRAGRVVECREGALERADARFATDRAPWCQQIF